ncbi:MAG: MMPL family transporter [Desulfobacterales bacterium]
MDKKIIDIVMRFRVLTLAVLIGITGIFAYGITKMDFYTEFIELFPSNHPYIEIHKEFMEYFGGANVATLVLEVKQGDVFTQETLEKMIRIQEGVERIPNVNPYQVFSIASRRVLETKEIAGGYKRARLMPEVPENESDMFDFKAKVFTNEAYGTYVSTDLKALRLQAAFIEDRMDYTELFDEFMEIRESEEDAAHNIYLAGEPVLYGWIYHHFNETAVIFLISCLILTALLFFFMGRQPVWWSPLISAFLSAVWGLGMSGFLGYQFDPLIIVVPFLLTARAMSHGVQWLNRFGHEFRRTGDPKEAARITGIHLFYPCTIGVVTDACGVLIVALIPIPILQHLAILGFFWGLSVIFTVSIFNPVFFSFLPLKRGSFVEKPHWAFLTNLMRKMAEFSITKSGKWILITASIVILVLGFHGFTRVPIGDVNPGSPVLWPDSDYNRSVNAINKRFLGMEQMYVLVEGNPNAQAPLFLPETMNAMDNLKEHLIAKGDVVSGFTPADVIKSFNRLVHENNPKYDIIPNTVLEIFQLLTIFYMDAAPEDIDQYMSPGFANANVRLFLKDHRGETLRSVIADVKDWIEGPQSQILTVSTDDPTELIPAVTFRPAGGLGGILAAANELIEKANHWLVGGILVFIFLCCTIIYRSFFAGFIFVISLILANFVAFWYMASKNIGLNINTVPVVSLGVGLGVDYGLYIVSQIKELILAGASWEKGIVNGVASTGRAVFYQAVMMSASVFFWWFSPLRFQAEMGFLLAILMIINMIVGVLLLPSLLHIFKPRFITRGGKS